jgi:hypothetical protein
MKRAVIAVSCLAVGWTSGCSGEGGVGSAELDVVAQAEDTITSGLAPGTGVEDISDGWSVAFSRYIAVLGNVRLDLATNDAVHAGDATFFAIDMRKAPGTGLGLWHVKDLAEGRWNFGYALGTAQDARQHETVDDATFAQLQKEDLTYWIQGALQKKGGMSCPPAALAQPLGKKTALGKNAAGDDCYLAEEVGFDLGVRVPVQVGPCEIDGVPGVAVSEGRTQTTTLTLHGDHLFFNGFPEGGEGGVSRAAQWLADCDLNLDGAVTRAELELIAPRDLAALGDVALGGSPITPVDDMWIYVTAQLMSQPHYQGEGECPRRSE